MRRTQKKKAERKRRRKVCCRGQILGHSVKSCMTVICTDGALSMSIDERASNMELAFSVVSFICCVKKEEVRYVSI